MGASRAKVLAQLPLFLSKVSLRQRYDEVAVVVCSTQATPASWEEKWDTAERLAGKRTPRGRGGSSLSACLQN